MKTPFDTVLRTRRREIDHVRIALHAQRTRLVEIEQASDALQREVAEEYAVAAEQWATSTYAYMRRRMAERAQLHASQLTATQEIETLRRQAAESYGSILVLEGAADRYRSDAQRQEQKAEQQAADDLSAIRIARIARIGMANGATG